MQNGKWDPMLDYRLTDVLEMNYSDERSALKSVKDRMLKRPIKNKTILPLFTFVLEDMLVVIHRGVPKRPRELFLLDARQKSFQTLELNRS